MFDPLVFRAYDIRGVATLEVSGKDAQVPQRIQISTALATAVGRSFGELTQAEGESCCIIGRDERITSKALHHACILGLRQSGVRVIDAGAVPSPVCYYAAATSEHSSSAIMVTASHNPAQDNGFKLILNGQPLVEEDLRKLRKLAQKYYQPDPLFSLPLPETAQGTLAPVDSIDFSSSYAKDVCTSIQDYAHAGADKPGTKVVVDCGNSVVGPFIPKILRTLGYEVIELYCEPDGRFPNHHPRS